MGDDMEGTEGEEMTRIDELLKNITSNECPDSLIFTNPIMKDITTAKTSSNGDVTGCRGITCEECWNMEVEDD